MQSEMVQLAGSGKQTLYTTPSACEAFVSAPAAEAFGFFVEVAEVTLASIRARSPGLNHWLEP